MSEKYNPICFPMSILFAEDSLVKLFRLLESGEVSKIQEERFSLKLQELLPSKDLHFSSLKMFPDFYRMTKGGHLRPCSPHFKGSGMMFGGKLLTLQISEFPNEENACSLSDITEEKVSAQFLLSLMQTLNLLSGASPDMKVIEYTQSMDSELHSQAPQEASEEKQGSI